MSHLRVLDLSYSSLEALPTSIANLTNLRLLSLQGYQNIRTLRPSQLEYSSNSPIAMLQKLTFLNLHGVPLTQVPEEIGRDKRCLYSLDLSCPTIKSLPQNLFLEMPSLRELFLLACTSLKSLPTSLTTLLHLEVFSLSQSLLDSLPCNIFEHMQRLRVLKLIGNHSLMHLPNSLSRASMLQELHIHDCTALREVNVAGHASLNSFSLSKSPSISCLSLCACNALETVALRDLNNLKELDLSFTSIKEFPLEICNQGSLRRLDLISACQLKGVSWHKLREPLSEVFNLVQHEYMVMGNQDSVVESLQHLNDGIGVKIFVHDFRILSKFRSGLLLDKQGENPRSLYICASEHRSQSMSRDMTSNNQFHKKNPYYEGIHLFENKFPQHFVGGHLCRQVEIGSVGRYLSSLQGILSFTESLLLRDNAFVFSLTDINPEFPELQECKVEGCHLMKVIFGETNRLKGKKLQNLWVSNLLKLTNVLHGSFQFDEFWALKCVNLRDCPRLVSIFPGNLKLPFLETLSIVCCYDLRSVFYYCQATDKDQFSRLRSIKLHQLPQLSQLYDCQKHPFQMPEWKELSFRGCWSLSRLPQLTKPRDQKVFVDGDIRQCKMFLSEMDEDQLSCYHFKSLPPVTSFKERVMNKIFLK
ncbi:NB-ARC domain-containing disease resistance protein [Rhynchospora pubera]|uniref:NB-ARC domain-containing disease resistance protein n=1 Tax=Rhynchospora pubera TaxID=906938 RepID=A0AAV8D3U9_9POAL|nr:NB-ARC domain-containing disease resistance protein [Rhynchospora pubera]